MANRQVPWHVSNAAAFNANNNKMRTGVAWMTRKRVMTATIDFDAPDLAGAIERLSQHDLDRLPFGVILIERDGTVLFYSETEMRQSGYPGRPLGQNLFEISHGLRQRCVPRPHQAGGRVGPGRSRDRLAGRLRRPVARSAHPRAVGAPRRLLAVHRARHGVRQTRRASLTPAIVRIHPNCTAVTRVCRHAARGPVHYPYPLVEHARS